MSLSRANTAQLTLGLFPPPEADFADFLGAGNALAQARLEAWATGAAPWCVGLWGAPGSGKSHLLQASIRRADALGRRAMYLPLRDMRAHGPVLLEGLEHIAALALDDIDAVLGDAEWAEGLFALHERCQAAGGHWVFAASAPPAALAVALRDLESRLSAALIFQLQGLDDTDKLALIRQHAAARGLDLAEGVAAFLIRRLPRGTHQLVAALAQLDAASLRAGRALTIPFVREVLGLEVVPPAGSD